jgi:hypothetical protein
MTSVQETETAYGRALREQHEAIEAELAAHACEQHTCVMCGVTGLAEHFELFNRRNWACRQVTLCVLRRLADGIGAGLSDASAAGLVMQLTRELGQVAMADRAAAGHLRDPWGKHREAVRPHRMLSTQDLARLHVTLTAAAGWLSDSGRADWGQQLAQARADLGCRRCGQMGPQPCLTSGGNERRTWHDGRRF